MNKSSFSDFGISCNFKDEGQRILNINARYVEHIDGELILISIEDVTHHRQEKDVLEALVAERTQRLSETIDELKNSNQNLKEFAYAASHDLQEPLRKIQTFSGILSGKADLPLEHKILVEKISTSSTRMRLLIYDLLLFSSLEKTETFMSPVDLSVVLTDVVNDFELLIKEKGAVIEIDNLPVIEAVQLQMNQLFFNLLSNALKFSNPGIKPRISLKVEKITHQEVARYIPLPFLFSTYSKFIFSDNGIGLDTRFSEQIFEVFKRLHGKEAYQGSGIGLALCRRVVTNHNGHLYVVSEEGKGTAFHIILPDRQHATQTLLSSEVTYN
jgi:light-regulated signal transduction histidine kinase (bacteriophytochrome)